MTMAFSGWGLSLNGFVSNKKGEWWLVAQIVVIIAHLYPALPLPQAKWAYEQYPLWTLGVLIVLTGTFLCAQAFIDLGTNLSPLPAPKDSAVLIREGSYKKCRHPLYRGLIISSLGITVATGSIIHLFLLIIFCTVLVKKAKREEKELVLIYSDYLLYARKTKAIIPNLPFLDWSI